MRHSNNRQITSTLDNEGVLQIVIDAPKRPLNVIDHDLISELESAICEIESRDDIRLVVIKSGKESGFLAGADIQIIQQIDGADEANQLLRRGQELFDRIEKISVPTMALIHGPCLGGGLELAMACDYRVARDNSSTKIGLPEIKLGLIPGWGGTQRLPRWVGLSKSLELILTGKHLSADQAVRIGLVDRALPPNGWRDGVIETIDRLLAGRSIRPRQLRRRILQRITELTSWGRNKILATARKRIESKIRYYPALESAINAIADRFDPRRDGYATERDEFVKLLSSPTCRSLLRLFCSREQARKLRTWSGALDQAIHRPPIRRIGIIGGGAMGAGISQVCLTRGYSVTVKEIDDPARIAAQQRIEKLLEQYANKKRLGIDQRQALVSNLVVSADADSLKHADCVVEAVVEVMDVKQSVLAETEQQLDPAAVLATNTSALSVSEMASVLKRPSQFAGLHFFNPVHRMELVEVVRGAQTDEATIAALVSLVKSLGKTPVVTADSPGFLVNRVLFPYLGEAVLMLREGHDVETIDREVRRFGMPMGPLELLDQVGLDVALHVAGTLRRIIEGVDDVIDVLEPLVEKNQTGVKSILGFYDYAGKVRTPRPTMDLVTDLKNPAATPEFLDDGLSAIARRLIYPMLAESIRCREQNVVQYDWAVDLAMVLGTGFAPHRGGPLAVVEQIGRAVVRSNLMRLRMVYGDRFAPPETLMDRTSSLSVGD